jgi:multiple sugar transport system permease protein
MTSTAETTRAGAATGRPRRGASPSSTGGAADLWRAVPWTLPALLLIFGVVFFPAGYMVFNSTRKISLALAQFLDKNFPGRRWVRMAIIVPWAASVVMTTTVFVYGLDPYYGIINKFLVDLHLLAQPFGFTKEPLPAFISSIGIAVFVSLPFTTYTILAGLAGIPGDMLEAAKVDGAGAFRSYFGVTLPNLRNAIALATLINIINVFNSLPILKLMTGSIPGYKADTTTTYVFKLLQNEQRIDLSSALSVINFLIVLVVVGLYLWIVKPMKEVS